MKNRTELAQYFKDKGFIIGAEIGVADGRYAEILCKTIPNLKYYGVDPWKKYEGAWRSDEYQEGAYRQAKDKLSNFPNAKLIRKTSLEAYSDMEKMSLLKGECFDFVFIDGAHDFDNVMIDIILWSRKVKKGGIVAGHDFYVFNGGVIPAVNAYIESHRIDLNLTLWNSAEHKDDLVPCWWFIKK